MSDYVKSSPHFFRLIKRAFIAVCIILLVLAAVVPAPLQEAADFGRVPNPSKSAWFLLWAQELVSYSNSFVYLIVAMGLFFALLPWLPRTRPAVRARWFPPEQRVVNLLTLASFVLIITLTIIGFFFRGENWSFVLPF
ncbi:MAG: selenite/tellurite reduction operon b-type cytochrome membrane protein ExtQ [Thermodesulfobacteriota bacterium]|jgi:hypothetical protein|nr:selenite/tellurite reduction operon b-type cytochrome membrane protein ExtQ [Thermodesulfobacteriota bacterium]